jgi:hypothetical protein
LSAPSRSRWVTPACSCARWSTLTRRSTFPHHSRVVGTDLMSVRRAGCAIRKRTRLRPHSVATPISSSPWQWWRRCKWCWRWRRFQRLRDWERRTVLNDHHRNDQNQQRALARWRFNGAVCGRTQGEVTRGEVISTKGDERRFDRSANGLCPWTARSESTS